MTFVLMFEKLTSPSLIKHFTVKFSPIMTSLALNSLMTNHKTFLVNLRGWGTVTDKVIIKKPKVNFSVLEVFTSLQKSLTQDHNVDNALV